MCIRDRELDHNINGRNENSRSTKTHDERDDRTTRGKLGTSDWNQVRRKIGSLQYVENLVKNALNKLPTIIAEYNPESTGALQVLHSGRLRDLNRLHSPDINRLSSSSSPSSLSTIMKEKPSQEQRNHNTNVDIVSIKSNVATVSYTHLTLPTKA